MLVSVVIPTYNRCGLLLCALSSVLAQTTAADEIIVVDDGSTDCTERLMVLVGQRAAHRVSPIRYHRIEHCGYPGEVRNIGIRLAQGELVAFLDDDDLWDPTKLERQLMVHRKRPSLVLSHTAEQWMKNGVILAHTDIYCDNDVPTSSGESVSYFNRDKQSNTNNNELPQSVGITQRVTAKNNVPHGVSAERFFDACLHKCVIGPSTVIVQRSAITSDGVVGGFRNDLEIAEDYELWIRLCASHPVDYIAEPLTIKCSGGWEQLSHQYHYIEKFRIEALIGILNAMVLSASQTEQAVHVLRDKVRIWCNGCIKRGRVDEAARYTALLKQYEIAT